MAPEEIATALRRQPFVPFRVVEIWAAEAVCSPISKMHFKDGFLNPPLQLADGFHPAPHGKASEVRVARQGLPPLSGLITSRRCVTLSAVTA